MSAWTWPERLLPAVEDWAQANEVLEALRRCHSMGCDEFDLLVGLARYCEDHWFGQGDPLYAVRCAIDLRNDRRHHDDPAAVVYMEVGLSLQQQQETK